MVTEADCEQLCLFDCGGVDLAKLRAAREGLGHVAHSRTTSRAYANDWRMFQRWCASAGREGLPASADTVGLYVTWLLMERGRKVNTAARHCASISSFHRQADLPNPVTAAVREVMTAVRRRRREQPLGKAALDPSTLVRAVRSCDASTNLGARDRALLVFGFATTLRRSELCRLHLSDVSFERRGLAVVVRYSKTDQVGRGRVLEVWPGKRAVTDPVRVLGAWLQRRGRWEGPLFCRVQTGDTVTRLGVTGDAISDVVKKAVGATGLDPAAFGAHSLRAGGITASAEAGRSDQEIMGLSGHASASVMRMYVRRARLFSGRNPLAGVL